jgi:hypothetical protein
LVVPKVLSGSADGGSVIGSRDPTDRGNELVPVDGAVRTVMWMSVVGGLLNLLKRFSPEPM